MALFTRVLTNVGDPLVYPDGSPIANKLVTFTLVTELGTITDALDPATHEGVSGSKSVRTNELGEFTIDLGPTYDVTKWKKASGGGGSVYSSPSGKGGDGGIGKIVVLAG